ncbi:hypothetical protein HNO89_000904 [Sporosarcina luteola]|nr:hypothetical protein [Sporosarcina luteola]
MKRTAKLWALLLLGLMLVGCSKQPNVIKGEGLTFSQYFFPYDQLNERENITYYKVKAEDDVPSSLPLQIRKAVHSAGLDQLPFTVAEETAYLVTSKDKAGMQQNQVQLGYFKNTNTDIPDDFFIISVTESDRNPLETYSSLAELDSVGNRLIKKELTEGVPIYQQVITTDSALLYRYYKEDAKQMSIVGTSANEFYTYYNGCIYHIGYSIDRSKNDEEMQEKMLQFVREFILNGTEETTV